MANVYGQGEHICCLYQTEAEQISTAAEYLAHGLACGERCFYVARSQAAFRSFHVALKTFGVDVNTVLASGALVESTHAEAHLAGGHFDCERMLTLLNEAVESALNAGFAGLRTCGDMSWLLGEHAGSDQVMEYEALLNQFFRGVRATGMCQYDRRRMPLQVIDDALARHSSLFLEGEHKSNPLYRPLRPRAADSNG
jgi:hypothetical protein